MSTLDKCDELIPQIRSVISEITLYFLICSIIGSFLTIVTFLIFPRIRTYSIKLVMFLSTCIMLGYTFFCISSENWVIKNKPWCIIVAFSTHYFFLANFCWTFCIAFNFYQMIVKRNREPHLLEKWYHLFSWGVPAVIVLVVGVLDIYGRLPAGCNDDGTCYIRDPNATFGAFFVPGVIIITVNVILFFLIGREIQETLAGAPKTDQKNRRQEFRVYLSIFVSIGVSWIFGYIEASIPEEITQLIFYIIFSFMTPAQGILIFFSHCVNEKVISKYCELFGKLPCFPCCNTLAERLQRSSTSTTASRSSSSRSGASSASSYSRG
eukprot:TRINITY_DN2265_c0_g1_i1.p1 TRINITY_DN2265_c0_g1~~TRINITY_DN2265_c0_g1_i1.p1  ORF type:complete len:323 (+),score=100.81 TRINITY_DN2265_c0_g1_i1:35-1003(+)